MSEIIEITQLQPKSERTRIVFVHHGLGIGGAPVSLANIIRTLDPLKFEIIVLMRRSAAVNLFEGLPVKVCFCDSFPAVRQTTAGSYRWYDPRQFTQFLFNPRAQADWRSIFARLKPEIVHLNSVTLVPLCGPAHAAGSQVVVSVRETVVPGMFGIGQRRLVNELQQHTDAVVYISTYDKDKLKVNLPIVEVVPNWVDLTEFNPNLTSSRLREELNLPDETRVILTLGGARRIKGTLLFLQAADRLRERLDCVFVVAGLPGPDLRSPNLAGRLRRILKWILKIDARDQIYSFYQNRHLHNHVYFLGHRRDIPEIMAATYVVVFPITAPHQSRPIIEAGAMAKPVIASDFDCLYEFVQNDNNGLLIPPNSVTALADAIKTLLDRPDLAQAYGQRNHEVALAKHDQAVNAKRVLEIYERLLARKIDRATGSLRTNS